MRVVCLLKNIMVRCGRLYLAENYRSSRCPTFQREHSQKHRRIFVLQFIFMKPQHCDRASDVAGMMECRTDAKESKLSKSDILNATCTLYFSHTDMAECKYHRSESPEIKKKNLAFFYLITPLNIPYHTCLAP